MMNPNEQRYQKSIKIHREEDAKRQLSIIMTNNTLIYVARIPPQVVIFFTNSNQH